MAKKKCRGENIIQLLCEVEMHTSEGKSCAKAVSLIGVAEQTYFHRWNELRGLNPRYAKKLKDLRKGE